MIKSCASEIVSSDVQFARVNLHKAAFISLVSNQFSRVLELVFILLSILSSCTLLPLTVYWAQIPQSNYCILGPNTPIQLLYTGPKHLNPTTVYWPLGPNTPIQLLYAGPTDFDTHTSSSLMQVCGWAQIPRSSRMRPDLSDELFFYPPER